MGGDVFFLARADTQLAGPFLSLASLPFLTLLHSSCFWTAGPLTSPPSNYFQLPLTHGRGLTRPAQKIKVCFKLMVSCSLPRPSRWRCTTGSAGCACPRAPSLLRCRAGAGRAQLLLGLHGFRTQASVAHVTQAKLPVFPKPSSSSGARVKQNACVVVVARIQRESAARLKASACGRRH